MPAMIVLANSGSWFQNLLKVSNWIIVICNKGSSYIVIHDAKHSLKVVLIDTIEWTDEKVHAFISVSVML